MKACDVRGVFWGAWTAREPEKFKAEVAELFDMVYVAVLTNPNKKPVFTAAERCGLLMEAARAEGLNNVCAEAYSGLAVDFAR